MVTAAMVTMITFECCGSVFIRLTLGLTSLFLWYYIISLAWFCMISHHPYEAVWSDVRGCSVRQRS